MGVPVCARPCPWGRASRSRVLLLAAPALGCTSRAPSGAPGLKSSLIALCRATDASQPPAAPFASLRELMTEAINPSLSVLSARLFHDPRPEDDAARGDEVAAAADRLAACFAIVPEHFAGPAQERADIEAYAALGKHNSRGRAMRSAARALRSGLGLMLGAALATFYAVAGTDGRFELAGVPVGRYRLAAYSPDLGVVASPIELKAGGRATIELALKAP